MCSSLRLGLQVSVRVSIPQPAHVFVMHVPSMQSFAGSLWMSVSKDYAADSNQRRVDVPVSLGYHHFPRGSTDSLTIR